MRIIWEESDIKAGIIVWDSFSPESERMIVSFNNGDGKGDLYGVVHINMGYFSKIGSGTKEAIVTHLNNNYLVPKEK